MLEQITKRLIEKGMVFLFLVALCIPAMKASAATGSVAIDNCVVNSGLWELDPDRTGLVTLPRALAHVNEPPDSHLSGCRNKITIDTDDRHIYLRDPLTVSARGAASGSTDNNFVIAGVSAEHKTVIEANPEYFNDAFPCVIKIEKSFVTLENLEIINVPAGVNAICGDADNIELKNVSITSAGGGVLFKSGTKDSVINPDVIINSGVGFAIDLGTTVANALSGHALIPVEGAIPAQADTNGLILPAAGQKRLVVKASTIDKLINSQNQQRVCLVRRDDEGSKVEFEGWVKNSPSAEGVREAAVSTDAARLQIYTRDGFFGFVGPQRTVEGANGVSVKVGMYTLTTDGDGQATGRSGYFRFLIDKSVGEFVLIPETIAAGPGLIGKLGAVSDIISVNTTDLPCGDQRSLDEANNPSGGDSNGDGVIDDNDSNPALRAGVKSFFSIQACARFRGIDNPGIPSDSEAIGYDTDGDGLADDLEDLDRDCMCDRRNDGSADAHDETCYLNPDTDGDGVADGRGFERQVTRERNQDQDRDGKPNALDTDSDNDGRFDGQEDRNAFLFRHIGGTVASNGYLYRIDHLLSVDPVRFQNIPQTCNIDADTGVRYILFKVQLAADGLTIVGGQELSAGVIPAEGEEERNTRLMFLACRNITVSAPANFNGIYDVENQETKATNQGDDEALASIDTDRDGFCDGTGEACSFFGGNLTLDECPTISGVTDDGRASVNGCRADGKMVCVNNSLLYGISPEYVEYDALGRPRQLRLTGPRANGAQDGSLNDNVPDIYQIGGNPGDDNYDPVSKRNLMKNICYGDMDKDGIPDCVETKNTDCVKDADTGLSYFDPDSDGDGLFDGPGLVQEGDVAQVDVCPAIAEQVDGQDRFEEGKERYSCGTINNGALSEVYRNRKILALFLDRDGDGLTDAEEDFDLNGSVNDRQNILERITQDLIVTIETHPLKHDSDNDELSDKMEKTTIISSSGELDFYLNPTSEDTDRDGLSDAKENRDTNVEDLIGNPELYRITLDINSSNGCEASLDKDTDPTNPDTDGDGLLDGAEVEGQLYGSDQLARLLEDPTFFRGNEDARRLYSSPVDVDADGDGLSDAEEYDVDVVEGGRAQAVSPLTRTNTSPCHSDTDGDGKEDNWDEEQGQCGTQGGPDECVPVADGQSIGGPDQDLDGVSDDREVERLHTDPNNPDSDGDGLKDGEEDCNFDGDAKDVCVATGFLESDPNNIDTDGDGLNDYQEVRFGLGSGGQAAGVNAGTDPTNADTDSDGIPDGPAQVVGPNGELIQSAGEDANLNGKWDAGETDPRRFDTDGDGLPDGFANGLGEDVNRNGIVDKDQRGRLLETDPRVPDTDYDGRTDFDDSFRNGRFNINNAVNGRNNEGCLSVANTGTAPSSMYLMIGMVLAVSRVMRRKEAK